MMSYVTCHYVIFSVKILTHSDSKGFRNCDNQFVHSLITLITSLYKYHVFFTKIIIQFFNIYMADNELVELFQSIGLTEQRAKETAKNKKLAPTLQTTIAEAGVSETGCDKATGALLYTLASTITKNATARLDYIARAIIDKKLKTADQVAGMIPFNIFLICNLFNNDRLILIYRTAKP